MTHQDFARLVDPAVHAHDQLVLEPDICVQEEVVELVLECLEQRVRYLVLYAGWQFIIKTELFNDEVEIIDKGILNEFFDRVVELVGYLFFLVAVFKPEQP